MLKVMRKYNKVILVVGGTLLMVAFLMPQAIQQFGKARKGKSIGSMDGHKITVARYDLATRELHALDTFFSGVRMDLPITLDEKSKAAHWLLLTSEAEQAGLVGGSTEGAALVPIIAREVAQDLFVQRYGQYASVFLRSDPGQFDQLAGMLQTELDSARLQAAGSVQMTPPEFDQVLARFRGVVRLFNMYKGAERLSDRQVAAIADRFADSVLIDGAFLDARILADETLEPTPEQLQAHFERFRELRPGEGEYRIGYKLPPRVKVEWIELNRTAMGEAVRVSLIDATKHWQQNRGRFPGPFDSEQEAVEAELRKAEVDRIMGTADSVVRSAVLTVLRPIAQDGAYRVLPDHWAGLKPDYMKLAEEVVSAVRQQHGVTIPLPAVFLRDKAWLDGPALQTLPGIGSAVVTFERQRLSFAQAVMAVRELGQDNALGVQIGVPAADTPAISGVDGSKYYFTVLDAAVESAPASIDELLDPAQPVKDWRALQRYEALVGSADALAATAVEQGLDAFAKSFGQLESPPVAEGETTPPAVDRVPIQRNASVADGGIRGLGDLIDSTEVVERVRAAAKGIDPMTPIDGVAIADRVLTVSIPAHLGVLVAQINGVVPLTKERLAAIADEARRQHLQETFGQIAVPYPYQFQVLEQRHRFSLKSRADEDGAEPPAPEEPAPTPEGDAEQG